jgi:hypothetical protein
MYRGYKISNGCSKVSGLVKVMGAEPERVLYFNVIGHRLSIFFKRKFSSDLKWQFRMLDLVVLKKKFFFGPKNARCSSWINSTIFY